MDVNTRAHAPGYFLPRLRRWYPISEMVHSRTLTPLVALLLILVASPLAAQDAGKRNGRPQDARTQSQPRPDENKRPAEQMRYSYEFTQPQFVIRHILIEHDAYGRGKVTFERQGEETAIIEPVELSAAAWTRITGFWNDLRFLDSTENYQSPKRFAHRHVSHRDERWQAPAHGRV